MFGVCGTKQSPSCLRKIVLQNDMILMMSLQGKVKQLPVPVSMGNLTMETNLCLSSYWFKVAKTFTREQKQNMFTRVCLEKYDMSYYQRFTNSFLHPNNLGEDRLVWESQVNHLMFEMNNNVVAVGLPGFLLNAEFDQSDEILCNSTFVIFSWVRNSQESQDKKLNITNTIEMEKGRAYFYEQHLYSVLSPNLEQYFEPPKRWTWFTAHNKCRLIGENLPSFVSSKDFQDFTHYIYRLSWNTLVTTVFIGLFGKVRIKMVLQQWPSQDSERLLPR